MRTTQGKTIKLLSEKEKLALAEREIERLSKQSAANKFDKIIKENAPESIDRIIEIALNLKMVSCEDYPSEVQYTLERRPDFLKKVVEKDGTPAIWHGEYQVPDEKKMIFRFLVYCGLFKRNEGNILVRQFAIYLGSDPPQMQTEINEIDLFFRFHLIPLINIPFELLLESGNPQEAILAMLADLHGEKPIDVIHKVIQTIVKNSDSDLEKQRHIQQLQVMSQLRNFEPLIDNIMESENLLEYVSIERTWFYKQGVKAAEAKFEKKLEHQEQRRLKEEAQRLKEEAQRRKEDEQRRILFEKEQEQRRKEDEQRRKEDEQRRKEDEQRRIAFEKQEAQRRKDEELQLKKQEQLIAALLLNDVMKKDKIALLAGSNLELVENIEAKIQKTKKLLDAQILTTEEIAGVMKVSNDFVKLVAENNNG